MKKNNEGIITLIERIAKSIFNLMSSVVLLANLEKLAGKNLIKIVFLILLAISFFTSTLICLSGLMYLYLTSLHYSNLFSLSIVAGLNIVLLLFIFLIGLKLKSTLFFPSIREQINRIIKSHKKSS